MYRNCIFCSASLGANHVLESLAAGSHIAFDPWKGRLWLVCPRCARWNLAPIEQRWEPVEEADKLFRDARLRLQGENIGLAQLPDGTRLIRIGAALPGELAAWRYGRRLLRRRSKHLLAGTATVAAVAATVASPFATLATIAGGTLGGAILNSQLLKVWPGTIVHRLPAGEGEDVVVRPWHIEGISVSAHSTTDIEVLVRDAHLKVPRMLDLDALANHGYLLWRWGVRRNSNDVVRICGEPGYALLRRAMIHVNGAGASHKTLADATQLLADSRSAGQHLREAVVGGFALGRRAGIEPQPLHPHASLALEMALNEETERRALEGDLHELDAAWREAEEIAAIADSLPLTSR